MAQFFLCRVVLQNVVVVAMIRAVARDAPQQVRFLVRLVFPCGRLTMHFVHPWLGLPIHCRVGRHMEFVSSCPAGMEVGVRVYGSRGCPWCLEQSCCKLKVSVACRFGPGVAWR